MLYLLLPMILNKNSNYVKFATFGGSFISGANMQPLMLSLLSDGRDMLSELYDISEKELCKIVIATMYVNSR